MKIENKFKIGFGTYKTNNMKNKSVKNKVITTLLACVLLAKVSMAQAPQAIPYQAVARNSSGVVLAFKTVGLRFTVFDTIAGARIVAYQETTPTTTNSLGLFIVNIGQGQPVQGSFSSINWGNYNMYIQIELDTTASGTQYRTIGTQQLMSVPYALYANTAGLANNATRATKADSANNGVPVGTIEAFAGPKTKIPSGWALCDGTLVSTTDPKYAALFAVIQYSWGGSTSTFNLPDTRGLFLRGQGVTYDLDSASRSTLKTGGNSGTTKTDAVGSYQADIYGSHKHGIYLAHTKGASSDINGAGYIMLDADAPNNGLVVWHSQNNADANYGATNNGSGNPITLNGGSETRPKNVYVNYIIKL